MDTLPLPPRPDLAQYRKHATELVEAAASHEPDAVRDWAQRWLRALAGRLGVTISPFVQGSLDRAAEDIATRAHEEMTLTDAQLLIARAHGFGTWRAFAEQITRLSGTAAHPDPFESGADAVVTGDLPSLRSLLRASPDLVRARSARVHRATLLHYVAANGVEDYRQRTPPNAVAIATALLEAGAEVDAVANTYGGGQAQTTMNLLVSSTHPAGAGLQPALVETLVDFGAAVDGLADDGSPVMTALAFGYVEAAEALARRGARIDNVMSAAALGRLGLVESLVADGVRVSPSLVDLYWLGLSGDPRVHLERALVWACAYGRIEVVRFLLAEGVDPAATDPMGMSGLHWAAANAHLDIVTMLTRRGAPLETRNRWGGTVLDATLHFALQQPADWPQYAPVVEALLAAGADVSAVRYPTGNDRVDEAFRSHGAR